MFNRPPRNADFEALIHMIPSEEGGRTKPAFNGYRPSHNLGLGHLNDGMHEYLGRDTIAPGETGCARIWLLCPEVRNGRLFEGLPFTVQEGGRIVASATISRVVNPTLRSPVPPGYLFTVSDAFEIAGTLILAPGAPPETLGLSNDTILQLRFPNGSTLDTKVHSIPILDPYDPKRPFAIAIQNPDKKCDLPAGTEVWMRHPNEAEQSGGERR